MQDFSKIEQAVLEAGNKARRRQKEIGFSFKQDGSVVTEVDLETERFLTRVVSGEFPGANIVSEEYPSDFQADREITFTIDPIDGTDSFSQGMPAWCIAVGILDSTLTPVGGIIMAPRWGVDPDQGIFISAIPGREVSTSGVNIAADQPSHTGASHLMIGSKVHRRYDLSSYPGKLRSFGSSVLHVISPLVHSAVEGALIPPCYIWDIAAAHGVIQRYGLSLEYMNGSPVLYRTMVHRQIAEHHIVCGNRRTIQSIRKHIRPL